MEKQTITFIKRDTRVSARTNKPFESLSLKTSKYGERYISGFGSATTKDWKVGDEVMIKVTPVFSDKHGKEFLNFEYEKGDGLADRLKRVELTLMELKPMFDEWSKKHADTKRGYEYPTDPWLQKEEQINKEMNGGINLEDEPF